MNGNILNKIKNIIGISLQNIKNKSVSDNHKKQILIYKTNFINMLKEFEIEHKLIEKLSLDFVHSLANCDLQDSQLIADKMWLTIYIYIESTVGETFIDLTNTIFLGLPGCGKTTLISSLILKQSLANKKGVSLFSNKDSYDLLTQVIKGENIIYKKCFNRDKMRDVIYELNDFVDLAPIMENNLSIKIYLVIDMQASLESLFYIKELLSKYNVNKISGIIITKTDFKYCISSILSAPFIFSSHILGITQHEITNKNRDILPSNYAISIIIKEVLGKKLEQNDELTKLLKDQLTNIDVNAYRSFISFTIKMDTSKMRNIFSIYEQKFKNKNGNFINNEQYEKIKNYLDDQKKQEDLNKNLKKHIYIIDSIRTGERKDLKKINFKAIERIAKGSGTTVYEVNNMITSYYQYIESIKSSKYKQFLNHLN